MKQPRVAFRADASTRLGWGHVKRCLALGDALRAQGAEVRFLAADLDLDVAALVSAEGHRVDRLADAHAPAAVVAALAGTSPTTHVVVDHYELDARWHREVRHATGAAIVVIDDLADRPLDPDLLVDQNPHPDMAAKYAGVLARPAPLCGGLAHALLDPVYAGHAPYRFDPEVRRIGIFMGGSDADDYTSLAWRACREGAGWRGPITLASTSANPRLDALRTLVARDAATTLLLDQPNLADFHATHDLQVGAGGGAAWERCCLGVPSVVLICADNQRASVPHLADAGAAIGFDAIGLAGDAATSDAATSDAATSNAATSDARFHQLAGHIRRLIATPAERLALHQRARALVDGRGAARVAARLLQLGEEASR